MDVERVRIIDKNSMGSSGSGGNSLNGVHMTHDDRHAYHEGIRRGGFLLCAEVDGDEDAGEIIRILEESSSVDFDRRQESWQSEGWAPHSAGNSNATATGNMSGQQSAAGIGSGRSGSVVEEERIPIVEEELKVGKREVSRGGARVRSYIREVPVHEEVTLREEHVQVERRPVDQSAARSGLADADLLQERTIEMRETAEEAVVQKVANVREELVVSKTATEHTEQIDDTVRRTEVELEEGARTEGSQSAFGSFGGQDSTGGSSSAPNRSDFERNNNSR
jgi:uncharacterized protein (TIGR02271 family)